MATITSAQSGLASLTTTWIGGVLPNATDKVIIDNDHTVELDGHYTWGDGTVNSSSSTIAHNHASAAIFISGTLKFSRLVDNSLTPNGIVLLTRGGTGGFTAGTFDQGTMADPIPDGVTSEFIVNMNSTTNNNNQSIMNNNASNNLVDAPTLTVVSGVKRKRNTSLSADAAAGQNVINVNDATNWKVGDKLAIAATFTEIFSTAIQISEAQELEEVEIQSIAGNAVTLVANLAFDHGYFAVAPEPELTCKVSNLTSNVIWRPFNDQDIFSSSRCRRTLHVFDNVEIQNGTSASGGFYYAPLCPLEIGFVPGTGASVTNSAFWLGGTRSGSTHTMLTYHAVRSEATITGCAFANFRAATTTNTLKVNYSGGIVNVDDVSLFSTSTSTAQTGVRSYQTASVFNNVTTNGYTRAYDMNNGIDIALDDCTAYGAYVGLNFFNATVITRNFKTRFCNRQVLGSTSWRGTARLIESDAKVGTYTFQLYGGGFAVAGTQAAFVDIEGDPLDQQLITSEGSKIRDNVLFKTGVASLRFDLLSSATAPLTNTWQIFAPSDEPVVVTGFIRKNSSYGNAILPTLTLSGLGITPSTFTMTDVDDEWIQFVVSGVQTTGTDGILTFTSSMQSGNAGAQAWIDGIVAAPTVPVNSGGLGYWADGVPAKLVASNFTSADDVWNKLQSGVTVPDSMGELVKLTEQKVDDNQALIIAT